MVFLPSCIVGTYSVTSRGLTTQEIDRNGTTHRPDSKGSGYMIKMDFREPQGMNQSGEAGSQSHGQLFRGIPGSNTSIVVPRSNENRDSMCVNTKDCKQLQTISNDFWMSGGPGLTIKRSRVKPSCSNKRVNYHNILGREIMSASTFGSNGGKVEPHLIICDNTKLMTKHGKAITRGHTLISDWPQSCGVFNGRSTTA